MELLQVFEGWFKERLPITSWKDFFKKKTVPLHKHTVWYIFGGAALFLFMVQVVTGILLLLYYRPSSEAAFESVKFIVTQVQFGWLVRSIHSWSANLFVLILFIHMFSVYFMKAYRKPRELTWVTGVLMFFIALGFGFTGYLLPWNKLSYFATKVGTEITSVVPFIGNFLLRFLRGGEDVTGATLTRLFGFHVAVLPALSTIILGIHLFFVQVQGMSKPFTVKSDKDMPFFPNFLYRDMIGWLAMLALLAALAAFFPWELGSKADPFAPAPAGIKPEWYFLFMFEVLKIFPSHVIFIEGEVLAILLFGAVGLFWLLVPFLDKNAGKEQRSPVFTLIGIIGIMFIAIFTLIGFIH